MAVTRSHLPMKLTKTNQTTRPRLSVVCSSGMDKRNPTPLTDSPPSYPESPNSRPILYLMRHAESENKAYSPQTKTFLLNPNITDPHLTPSGRDQALAMGIVLEQHLRSVTHILSSPLSRCLESACLTFKSAIERGVKVCAVPELQSMGILPNGTGLSLEKLKGAFEDTAGKVRLEERVRAWCGDERIDGGRNRSLSQGERDRRVFKGQIDFGFMCEDWNNPEEKRDGTDGRYVGIGSRLGFIRGFLKGLQTGCRTGERLEVVVVTHSSLIREWVVDEEWETNELCPWFYDFCADGYPKMKDPSSEQFVRYSPDSFIPDRSLLSFVPKPKERFEKRDIAYKMNGSAAVESWTWNVQPVVFVDHKGNEVTAMPTILEIGKEDCKDTENFATVVKLEAARIEENISPEALPLEHTSNIAPEADSPHQPNRRDSFLERLTHLTNSIHR